MSDESDKINELLHNDSIEQNYTARSGETLRIQLPRIPMLRETQFLKLKRETRGDVESFVETSGMESGEGVIAPTEIYGTAVSPGTVNIILKAVDRISGEEMPDVEPLRITVNVKG